MEKHINYIARTFDDYRSELINFSKKYYPEIAESYNDSAIGSWLIDVVAGIGDNMSYSIDRMSQEQSIDSANLASSVYNVARLNGIKIPGPKGSMCEVAISCNLPAGDYEDGEIVGPNWAYAPIVKRSTIVSAGDANFQLDEDVDFGQQFNSDAYSNRTYAPLRNANGQICGYTVTKTAIAVNGTSRIYKKVINGSDLKPFMEIILPDLNVMNVESIIFKETSNFNHDPDISDFYNENEVFQIKGENVKTYRYFEVEGLADQYRFGASTNDESGEIVEEYEDYTEDGTMGSVRTTRYYKGEWKPIQQKFITEFTNNGYLKITFGPGVRYTNDDYPASTQYGKWRMSKIINNDMLGVLPSEGWTMYVLYRVGGGISSNIAPGAINSFTLLSASFRDNDIARDADASKNKGYVLNSISVTNTSPAIAGKDAPSVDELKALIKYNNIAQERCLTLKDYKARLMMMPPKFGSPFRASVAEVNNKVVMSLLNIDADGKMTKFLPETLVNNISEYMSNYKTLTDYIEIKSGRIYNIGFNIDLFVSKNYDTSTVVTNVIDTIKNYMAVASHDMGEDIFVGDIEKQISLVDGVISIIALNVYIIYGGSYSNDRPLYPLVDDSTSDCSTNDSQFILNASEDAKSGRVDLDKMDHVLYCDNNAILEVKFPENDIQIRTKVR